MEKEKHPDKSCWACAWHKSSPTLLFGYCTYFESIGKEKKEIPKEIVDMGCKYFKESKPF